MESFNFSNYQSVFSWRYGSGKMRRIFSEENKYKIWRRIWVALAQAQSSAGLVSKKELSDLKKQQNNIDIERILQIEGKTHHDVVAAIKEYAEKAKIGGGKIHLGATSMDIVDNADVIRIQEAFVIIEKKLTKLLKILVNKIEKYAKLPCIGYTHLQPAEPTTVGYRLAFYAQDLLTDYENLQFVKSCLETKGMKGAVGTAASYKSLLRGTKISAEHMEKQVMKSLEIKSSLITSQIYSRKTDYLVLCLLAGIASSLAKFAGDLRILQSSNYGEWSEPFGKKQIGSSAMPFKKNPISCENICSLARYVALLPAIAIQNASYSHLERTLDDSANRRIIIPQGFLATDQILTTSYKIISGIIVNKKRIEFNLNQYAPFAATEVILLESVKNGADRQKMHELLRKISMQAWKAVQEGKPNPMESLLTHNKKLAKYIKARQIHELLDISGHTGNASQCAIQLLNKIKRLLKT